jgi:hypothetical protein
MKVEVTWEFNGRYKKEVLELAPYEADVVSYLGTPLDPDDSEYIKREGFVLFIADDGMCCLQATQIVNMQAI